ncbi:nuclear transport factor 2 family protein [Streptomyces sp. NPDC059679]|uniref:nuclear transport factor 2 family protein n=1 Tax=Streptomyces sp. NPDC059679 TaxID=3346903 RepID=UPI003691DD84
MPGPAAPLTEFIRAYEQATNSHDITRLVPLIAPEAVYWFSDGSHRGREAVLSAITKTFATIRDEIYEINDLEWIAHSDDHAVCRYRFTWWLCPREQTADAHHFGRHPTADGNRTVQQTRQRPAPVLRRS